MLSNIFLKNKSILITNTGIYQKHLDIHIYQKFPLNKKIKNPIEIDYVAFKNLIKESKIKSFSQLDIDAVIKIGKFKQELNKTYNLSLFKQKSITLFKVSNTFLTVNSLGIGIGSAYDDMLITGDNEYLNLISTDGFFLTCHCLKNKSEKSYKFLLTLDVINIIKKMKNPIFQVLMEKNFIKVKENNTFVICILKKPYNYPNYEQILPYNSQYNFNSILKPKINISPLLRVIKKYKNCFINIQNGDINILTNLDKIIKKKNIIKSNIIMVDNYYINSIYLNKLNYFNTTNYFLKYKKSFLYLESTTLDSKSCFLISPYHN